MSILEEKRNLIIIAIAALIAGSVLITVLNSGSMSGGNNTLPAEINASQISQKLEPRLYELLRNMSSGDKIQVSIWIKEQRSGEEIATEIAARYPEANLEGTRPSQSTNMTLYEKIYREMEGAKKEGIAGTERPVIDYLTSRGINVTYASMYAPVIYAQLFGKEVLAVSEHEDVSAVYLAVGHLPEKIVDIETTVLNETHPTNESVPAIQATDKINDTLPAGINESGTSQKFEWSPKFEKRLYEILKGMSPGDKIQVSIWLRVPAGGHGETLDEKRKFYADIEKPVIDYLNSKKIEIQYASMFAPLIYVEISKKELFALVQRDDVTGIYVTFSYSIKREKPVVENKTTIIIPMVEATGQAFNESAGILTNRWDAKNFEGFWHDEDTGASTEELVIDQSINSNRRVIEKHNLIYRTRVIPSNFIVFRHRRSQGWSSHCGYDEPDIKKKSYQTLGWLGEEHAFLGGNNISKIIEQKTSEEKKFVTGESWEIGEGYRISINSIDNMEGQTWIILSRNGVKLDDIIRTRDRDIYIYEVDDQTSTPIFITHLADVSHSDIATLRYTWARSQNNTDVKEGSIFGVMEVTSASNGTIELRNREPIVIEPGYTINLMGNISFQVENSSTGLLFYPHSTRMVRKDGTYPSLIGTISAEHPVLRFSESLNEVIKDYYLADYAQECGDGGNMVILNITGYRNGSEENILIRLQNDYKGKEKLRSLEIIPKKDESLSFRTISTGNLSGYMNEAFMIINNRTDWNNVWKKHSSFPGKEMPSPPEINFMDETAVAVFLGDSPAYDTDIIDINREGENVYLNLRKKYPVGVYSGQPYFIVSIPKITGRIIFRTLRYEYEMSPQLIERALETVSRNNSITMGSLKIVRSRSFEYPAIGVRKWEVVVADRTSGKEYVVYFDE